MKLRNILTIEAGNARPQRSQQLVDFTNGPLAEILAKEDVEVAKAKEQLQEKENKRNQVLGPERPPWMLENKANPYDPPNLQPKAKIEVVPNNAKDSNATEETKESKGKSETPKPKEVKETAQQPKSILKKTVPKASSNKPKTTEITEADISKSSTDAATPNPMQQSSLGTSTAASSALGSSIATEELIELEILAEDSESDFDPGDDFEYIEQDYTLDSQDEDDDDESEDEYGRTRGSFFPFALPKGVQKVIQETRSSVHNAENGVNLLETEKEEALKIKPSTSIEHVTHTEKVASSNATAGDIGKEKSKTEKRSVRFSEAIEVKTFEKDPRNVHGNIHGNMAALFGATQQQRTASHRPDPQPLMTNDSSLATIPYNGPARSEEQELLDIVFPDASDATGNFMLRGGLSNEPIRPQKEEEEAKAEPEEARPKVSRFKAERMSTKPSIPSQKANNSQNEAQLVVKDNLTERGGPVSSIVERDSPVSENIKEQAPSDTMKEKSAPVSINTSPVNPNIVERTTPIQNTILERKSPISKPTANIPAPKFASKSKSQDVTEIATSASPVNNKPKVSRFKAQRARSPLPTSSRIQELSSSELRNQAEPKTPSFTNVAMYPSAVTSGKQGNAPPPKTTTDEIANPDPVEISSGAPRGIESLTPGLASGMRSLFSPEVLAKADEYYQQSLLTEEDFIRAHLGDESNEAEAEAMAAEREEYEKKQKEKLEKLNAYKTRPMMEDTLVEREVAPRVSGQGMGFVPDEYLHSHEDDDEDDDDEDNYEVNRAEIAREYQKIRQSLIYQTGGYGRTLEELELEPVDDEGNVKKMSRFKAARLSTRRM